MHCDIVFDLILLIDIVIVHIFYCIHVIYAQNTVKINISVYNFKIFLGGGGMPPDPPSLLLLKQQVLYYFLLISLPIKRFLKLPLEPSDLAVSELDCHCHTYLVNKRMQ